MKRPKLSLEKRISLSGYVFTLPWVLGFLIFMTYPFVTSFFLSIGKIDQLAGLHMHIIGFEHYQALFTKDVDFLPALFSSLQTVLISVPMIVVVSLTISLLTAKKMVGMGVFRVIFFLPVLLGTGLAMQQLGDTGNILQLPSGIKQYIEFYFAQDMAKVLEDMLVQLVTLFWKCGVQIIIFIGGIQSIPDTYYEAARVDNANAWDALWKITLPMLSPIIFLNVIYTIIDTFRDSSNPITKLVISQVFTYSQYEYGSAMGWVYFAVAFAAVGLAALIFRRYVYYEK